MQRGSFSKQVVTVLFILSTFISTCAAWAEQTTPKLTAGPIVISTRWNNIGLAGDLFWTTLDIATSAVSWNQNGTKYGLNSSNEIRQDHEQLINYLESGYSYTYTAVSKDYYDHDKAAQFYVDHFTMPTSAAQLISKPDVTATGMGNNVIPRPHATATLLETGKVLIAGSDYDGLTHASAELYDPATHRFSSTGSLQTSRAHQCAVRLADGRVLITGGVKRENSADPEAGVVTSTLASAEIFNPATGVFSQVAAPMLAPRQDHGCTLLDNGQVLVVGGSQSGSPVATAELFNPATSLFTAVNNAPALHADVMGAVKLASGSVVVVGSSDTASIYDPASNQFSLFTLKASHADGAASLLPNGKILIADKKTEIVDFTDLNNKRSYLITGREALHGNMSVWHAPAALLQNGYLMLAGGELDRECSNAPCSQSAYWADYFDYRTETFSDNYGATSGPMLMPGDSGMSGMMPVGAFGGHAITLKDGNVLLVGGEQKLDLLSNPNPLVTPVIYDIAGAQFHRNQNLVPGVFMKWDSSISGYNDLDFNNSVIGYKRDEPVFVYNTSPYADLTVTRIDISGDQAARFTAGGGSCGAPPFTVKFNHPCWMNVSYTPTQQEANMASPDRAIVSIVSNDAFFGASLNAIGHGGTAIGYTLWVENTAGSTAGMSYHTSPVFYTLANNYFVPAGIKVTVVATPSDGAAVMSWTGCDSYTGNSCTVTMNSTRVVSALVKSGFYNINFISNSSRGAISGTSGQVVASGGSTTPVTAVATTGNHFVSWTGPDGFVSMLNPLTITNVTESANIVANFASDTYEVRYNIVGEGTITGSRLQAIYPGGSTSAVTAVPAVGQRFQGWIDEHRVVVKNDNPLVITNVSSDIGLDALFVPYQYSITYVAGANGSITGSKLQSISYGGSTSSVTAVPATGYRLVNWTGSNGFVATSSNPLTLSNVKAEQVITANFAPIDAVTPTGSISIKGALQYVASPNVTLALPATDNVGVTQMRFSLNNSTWSGWEAYSSSKNVVLPGLDGVKKLWVQYRDAALNVSAMHYTIVTLDSVVPTGTFSINAGAALTATRAVNLALQASDNSAGRLSMRFCLDNYNWTPWEAFATTKNVTLPDGSGLKKVYVQYRDAAGNVSPMYYRLITYSSDTTAPTGSIALAGGADSTTSSTVVATLSATDAGSGVAKMRFCIDGVNWLPWEAYATSKTLILLPGTGVRKVWVQFRDAALNNSTMLYDTITVK